MTQTPAFAKINLGLEVLRKRNDGYHDINTIFARVTLHDKITIEHSETVQCSCTPTLMIPDEQNLAFKAVELFRQTFPNSEAAKITIQKHIPNGAGLGGGSSDAAAVLRYLCSLNDISPISDSIIEIATKLGSDVPYFLQDGTAIASGKGEELYYFSCVIPYFVVLVFPAVHISTPWAYKELKVHPEGRTPKPLRDILLMGIADPVHLRDYCVNDFERVVFEQYPEIGNIKSKLYEHGSVFSLMSGSGSTVYGLFHTQVQALQAAYSFSKEQTYVCKFVS